MQELNKEEINFEKTDVEVLDLKPVEAQNIESRKESNAFSDMISNLFKGEMILPLVLFAFLKKKENENSKLYLGDKLKEVLDKAENVLDIMYALDHYAKNQTQLDDTYETYDHLQNRTMEILEVVRPHIHGKGRQKIDQALAINDRMNQLKQNYGEKRNVLEDMESIADILEILELEKGHEAKKTLNKAKEIMKILKK